MVQASPFSQSSIRPARATLRGVLPPKFDGIVSVYPQTIFRPTSLETKPSEGVLMFVDGQAVPLDGKRYRIAEREARSLTIGSFIAAHLVNEKDVEAPFELVARGIGVDVGGEIAAPYPAQARIGRVLLPVADEPPATDEPEDEAGASSPADDMGPDAPDSTDDEPPLSLGADSASLKRSALVAAISGLFASVVAPMIAEALIPEASPSLDDLGGGEAAKAGALEEIHVTEREGSGPVEPPPGEGWQARQIMATPSGGVRVVWHRCAACVADAARKAA